MSASISHALLLAAGLGTRLRPLTLVRAKPAIPVAGIPMACRIIGRLRDEGITDVVLNLHHLPATIAAAVGDGSQLGVRARYSWEHPLVLGSAGGPRQALDIIGADEFLIVNGDTLTDAAVAPLVAAHQSSGARVTMAVIPNAESARYSGLRVAPDGAVLGVEPRGSSNPSFHFIGVQVAHRRVFEGLAAGRPAHSVGEVYATLIAEHPGAVCAHLCDAAFQDIGTVADYWHTSRGFGRDDGAAAVPPDTVVGSGAEIVDSIVWDGVAVGPHARVTRCIVTDGVQVAPDAVHSDAVLLRGPDGRTVSIDLSKDRA